jgi:hypothetical protein
MRHNHEEGIIIVSTPCLTPCLFSPRSARFIAPVLTLILVAGCGQQEYEELVTRRISELRNPTTPSTPEWEDFTSQTYGYAIEVPAKPTVTTQTQQGTEKLAMRVADTSYEVQFVEGVHDSLETAAASVRDLYSSAGFAISSTTEEDVNGLKATKMQFAKVDTGDAAMVQVVFLSNTQQTCSMAVIGSDYAPNDAERFFQSFSPN